MPDPLSGLSEVAEEAVSDIRLIVHDYGAARMPATATPSVGRFQIRGAGYGDRTTQFAVANIVGVVEHYAEQVLLDKTCDPKKLKAWDEKAKAWLQVFKVDPGDADVCPSFGAMRGYYEARNAIMHRRGELTDSQRKQAVYDRLAAADIERVAFHIVVSEDTVNACALACIRCVEELDATTRTNGEITA
jgi:hypothetical protein